METFNEVNELLTTKMCSPVIIFGVIIVISLFTMYFVRQTLSKYNTSKMENLSNLYSLQELKYLLILGIIMYGLCQYNKTELAWIFLLFPIIYVIIQNVLLYIHVSSGLQNAPVEAKMNSYNSELSVPSVASSMGPSPPAISTPEKPVNAPDKSWELPKISIQSSSLTDNYFSSKEPQGWSGF